MDWTDKFSASILQQLMGKSEPKLAAELKRRGVSSVNELPRDVASQILQQVMLQAAFENFPDANLAALEHGMSSFQHPLFWPAFKRVLERPKTKNNAFAMAEGIDAAIVLAAFGLPVAPFDRKSAGILAEPSNKIEEVAKTFAKLKSAYVGYSPCDVPFYMLVTDCVKTASSQIQGRPELSEVKKLLERLNTNISDIPAASFQHGIAMIPREAGDSVSMILLENSNPHEGSVVFYAGWKVGNVRYGCRNDGFVPVPVMFLDGAVRDPGVAMWIWEPKGIKSVMN